MVLPATIGATDPTDPLLLLPLPSHLPESPLPSLPIIVEHLDQLLSPTSTGNNATPPAVLTAHMRRIMRDAQTRLNAARASAAEARTELDKRDTELRGVEYERNRIKEEISRCMEYAPAYTAANLPDKQIFLDSAPEEIKSSLPSADDEEYEYAIIIAQLEQELRDIEAREKDVEALTKDRDSLVKAKKEIKLKFDLTETWLTDYARSTSVLLSRLKEPLKINPPALSSLSAPQVEITVQSSTPTTEDPPVVPVVEADEEMNTD